MTESGLEREQRRLATEINVLYLEENLYLKLLRNRDIPYETRFMTFNSQNITTKQSYIQHSTFDSKNIKTKQPGPKYSKPTKLNSKGVRPEVLPRQSSLKNIYE